MTLKRPALLRQLWSLRHETAGVVLHWSGVGRLFELASRPSGAIILMYHSVAASEAALFVDPPNRISPEAFARQMDFLKHHRRVVPLAEILAQMNTGITPPSGTVCITLDDGYLDNLTIAAPILERYRLPATLYLATGYVERGETQWADVLYWMFRGRTVNRLSLPSIGLRDTELTLRSARSAALGLLHAHLLESVYEVRVHLLGEVKRQLAPSGKPPRLTMNWDEARELRRRYPFIEVGGHTRDHIDLRTHRGAMAGAQVRGCADDLRRELGILPEHFSFPYSRWCAETKDAVKIAGWKSAVGEGNVVRITAASDAFAMPRVESPRSMTELRFKTSGAYPGSLAMLGLK